jgi:hypothetical protein
MPELCRFMGIVIRMYRHEHPPAHFHAIHAEQEATYGLDGIPLQGELHRRQDQLVREWAALHQQELRACWDRARGDGDIGTIEPLT